MIVDGSVVMMDHIFAHLARGGSQDGVALRIEEAAREVGRPVFFAVGVILIVFAPLFTLQGVEGKLFQPTALAIVLAMLASVLVALTVVPALASYSFRRTVVPRTSPLLHRWPGCTAGCSKARCGYAGWWWCWRWPWSSAPCGWFRA